jgi:hypothetical protein
VYPYAAAFSRFSISVMEAGGRLDFGVAGPANRAPEQGSKLWF